MIKRNQYFLLLIKEIIEKIIKCKHFIKLNIIIVFNRFCMHFNSENYTTFIIISDLTRFNNILTTLYKNFQTIFVKSISIIF